MHVGELTNIMVPQFYQPRRFFRAGALYFTLLLLSVTRFEHTPFAACWYSDSYPGNRAGSFCAFAEKIHQLPRRPAPKPEHIVSYQSRGAIDYFSTEDKSQLQAIVNEFLAIPNDSIWSVVTNISEDHPYVFFHARKASGSTLRGTLFVAAKTLGLSSFVACERGVHCDTYHIPNDVSYAVYALHMQWGELKVLEHLHRMKHRSSVEGVHTTTTITTTNTTSTTAAPPKDTLNYRSDATTIQGYNTSSNNYSSNIFTGNSSSSNSGSTSTSTSSGTSGVGTAHNSTDSVGYSAATCTTSDRHHSLQFSCATNLRDPVGRLLSCVEFRFLREPGRFTNATCIADVTTEELYHLLAEEVDDYSNSCINEPFRIFSGLYDEDDINTLGLHFDPVRHLALPRLSSLSAHVFRETLMRYALCTPYIMELPEQSTDLLAYKFPVLYDAAAYRMDRAANVHKSRCSRQKSVATQSQMALLEHFAAYERVLYDAVVAKLRAAHEEQMAIAEVAAAVMATKHNISYPRDMPPPRPSPNKHKSKAKSKSKSKVKPAEPTPRA